MPSSMHEALVGMFRHRPALAAQLLSGALGIRLPPYRQIRLDPGESTAMVPTEYRADAVVVLTDAQGPALGVVIEVQLGRDDDKPWSWPVYVATLRARLRCPVLLLVVCVDTGTAGWAAGPVELGPNGSRLVPVVVTPQQVPVVTETAEASKAPELAVLSALAHGGEPDRRAVLEAMLSAVAAVEEEQALAYYDLVLAALPAAARAYLEELMATGTYEYQSEFARRYFGQGQAEGRAEGQAEGRAEGQARAVLGVLEARGIEVPDPARARITGCRDLDQLDTWVRRAATVGSIDELFGW